MPISFPISCTFTEQKSKVCAHACAPLYGPPLILCMLPICIIQLLGTIGCLPSCTNQKESNEESVGNSVCYCSREGACGLGLIYTANCCLALCKGTFYGVCLSVGECFHPTNIPLNACSLESSHGSSATDCGCGCYCVDYVDFQPKFLEAHQPILPAKN